MTAVDYLEGLDFSPDAFQSAAAEAIDRGDTVVVTAPTGSGKTLVAEAAIHVALERGQRSFYTTPIKALSNQKYREFAQRYGADRVGLLTGDNSINGSAAVVVMTTEVLRNMMYAESKDLDDVAVVVLDEVHYLQDRARGGVWEEIIIHLDRSIPLVCLSATVANAEEFSAWIEDRRGPTTLVVEENRPVPLDVAYLMRDRFSGHELRLMPALSGGRPNERIISMLRRDRSRRNRYATPRRHETCELMRRLGQLPAIYFIFSRKGCEAAARTVVDRGLHLTSAEEAVEIARFAASSLAHLADEDLDILGYSQWLRHLTKGVSAHHAGMVPAMKETVEALFARGLVKVVFATETLALGINMPARTVIIESLSKFNGESHETLQPGDFTQLTGRAGRRGIDTDGTAVVLHSEYLDFGRVAAIAARGSHALRSSFRPTYNMAANLIGRYTRATAERLLTASFAEFSGSRAREGLALGLAEDEARLLELRQRAEHPTIDIWARLDADAGHPAAVAAFVAAAPPGTVLEWEERGRLRRVAVLALGTGAQPRILAVTEAAETHRFASRKLPATLSRIGRIELPHPFRPRHAAYRVEVAARLRAFTPNEPPIALYSDQPDGGDDVRRNLDAARAARRLEARVEERRRRAGRVEPGIVQHFDRITSVLGEMGYVSGWQLSDKGERLRTVYSELDLLLVETIAEGGLDGLDPVGLAGVASVFTYQSRGTDEVGRWTPDLADRGDLIDSIHVDITKREATAGIQAMRAPDPGFAEMIGDWTAGASLGDLFGEADLPIGDFVRSARQLLDLLRQLSDLPGLDLPGVEPAIRSIDRGVVAAAGIT